MKKQIFMAFAMVIMLATGALVVPAGPVTLAQSQSVFTADGTTNPPVSDGIPSPLGTTNPPVSDAPSVG